MNTPRLSIVMPMRNCAHCVCNILDDLWQQEKRHDIGLEIIVVDDNSSDGSQDLILDWAKKRQMALTLLCNEQQLWSYGSRLAGMAVASAPFVWNVDADDRIPEYADISRPLARAEKLDCDILHCRAVGVRPPSPLHLPLAWTEPVDDELQGQDIFGAFMAQSYPPAILWNKFFSRNLVKKIVAEAPAIEVRYFDVKFLGILSLLFAQSYHACNEVIYEYRMREHRPAELYARQVASMLLLREYLAPLVEKNAPGQLPDFSAYCDRRLTIQAGHLCIMAREELKGKLQDDLRPLHEWMAQNLWPNIDRECLFLALRHSIIANAKSLGNVVAPLFLLFGLNPLELDKFEDNEKFLETALPADAKHLDAPGTEMFYGKSALSLSASLEKNFAINILCMNNFGDNLAFTFMMSNAALAKMLTSIMAPQTDITKKAN